MPTSIRSIAKRSLARRGYLVQRATDRSAVLELIAAMRPMQTQFPLIRFGGSGDGGYLVPDALDDVTACFSPGVADVSTFELDCLRRGMTVFMADKSVEDPQLDPQLGQSHFEKRFIGCVDDEDYLTMDSWVESAQLPADAELMLQMDIEGGEYPALTAISPALLRRFKVIVLELHYLQNVWKPDFFTSFALVMDRLLTSHVCVHIHPNTIMGVDDTFGVAIPRVLEVSLLRRDAADLRGPVTHLPHPLDEDNAPGRHLDLPPIWYGG